MIHPNKKYRSGHLEISCYGKKLIMVNHPALEAPLPVGPQDEDEFWSKDPTDRLETVLEYLVKGIDMKNSDPGAMGAIMNDVDRARAEID